MSMKTGCYQDLSIGGIMVRILTHDELEELKKCKYSPIGIHSTRPYFAPADSPMDKWCALHQGQEQGYVDRRTK